VQSKLKEQNILMPDRQDKCWILHDAVFYEMLFTFGISPHDETDYCAWEHINFSRMGHARALYNFFETSLDERTKRRERNKDFDDVISEDFGFPAQQISRPGDDRLRLNKDLFHITYKRTRHRDNPEGKPWPDTIISCLHEPCIEFVKHLLKHKNEFGEPTDFKKWGQLFDVLISRREFQIRQGFIKSGTKIEVEQNYSFTLGRPLQSGGCELTKPSLKTGG
jgi:hypothetical protein